eukprot:8373667-Pyramimonas_sp.AAC.1
MTETHIHRESDVKKWTKASRALNLRMIMNSARRTSKVVSKAKEAHSNEGGEMFFSRKHLQSQQLPEARAAA